LPKFLGNGTITTNEHLVAFSNACHNIGENDNDTCMCLFVNSLEGKLQLHIFLTYPLKYFLRGKNWSIGLNIHMGQPKIPTDQLREYNNITYNNGETIKSFNLRFTKLYNQIPELIHPRTKLLSCIITMLYPLPIIIDWKKRL
jgi:hypothetical protein